MGLESVVQPPELLQDHLELSKVLKLDSFETDALLKRHQVGNGGLTPNDLEMDRAVLDRVLGPATK